MENMEFGKRLRELRKQAGLTQRELADKVNISFTYLSKIESGAMPPPSRDILFRLADALDIDREELLISAGRIPSDIAQMLKNTEIIKKLRSSQNRNKTKAIISNGRVAAMKSLANFKGIARVTLASLLAVAVATSLWFAGPTPIVKAVDVTFSPASPSGTVGSTVNFTMKLDIADTELLPVKSVDLIIGDAPFSPATYSDIYQDLPLPSSPNETVPTASMSGTTSTINVSSTSGAGWGSGTNASRELYGYGYDAFSSSWLGWGYLAPLGTNFGYGYGDGSLTEPTSVTFTVAWQVPSSWPSGTYYATARIWGDTNKSVIESTTVSLSSGGGGGTDAEPGVTVVANYVTTSGTFTRDITATSSNNEVNLTIGEGTTGLTATGTPIREISILEMVEADVPPSPEGGHIIGLTYDFGPDGATFDEPITLTFTYDPDNLPEGVSEEDLVVAVWDGDAVPPQWVELPSVVDPVTYTITAT
ncbi:helix-turn-helix domain-containing protein, partial [Chloroflexota bacterium]